MSIELLIQNGGTVYYPAVKSGAKLTLERKGVPGKLTFSVLSDSKLNIAEGNAVKLTVDGTVMFFGFIFTRKSTKDSYIDITAYDQLRYLKNKDTYIDEGLSASDLIKRIATDFELNTGTIEATSYKRETVVEENQSLFDIIQNALDEELLQTGKLYVLYDDGGKLTLQNINSMKLDLLIDASTGENYDYTSSIDSDTYNKIKLAYKNESTGKREIYIAQSGENINEWGVLQYYDEIDSATGAADKADSMLDYYNRKTRSLSVKGAFGDPRVKAGSSVAVYLELDDVTLSKFMVVDKVTHRFDDGRHTMDIDLIGGDFNG